MSAGDHRHSDVPAKAPGDYYERAKAMVKACDIVRGFTIPYAANRSIDGKRYYPDDDLPKEIAGVTLDRTVPIHEFAEFLAMNDGMKYPEAHHDVANPAERQAVEEEGGDWKAYCAGFAPVIKQVDREVITRVPQDLDLRPYQDEDDHAVMAELAAAGDKSGGRTMVRKFYSADVVVDGALGPRQIRVVANSGQSDRVKDVLVAKGCKLDNYLRNPIVLAQHNPENPVGNFAPEIKGERVEGVLTFAPAGISAKADEYCGLYKAGVLKTVSVGFQPIDSAPNKDGGELFKEWELLELSCVSVPCDPGALTIARSLETKTDKHSWKCGASRNLPIGGDDAWDGPAASASIFDHCNFDGDSPDVGFARKGFLAYDAANPKLKGSYKLPFAKIVDGHLTAMPSGIRAAASRLPQADIPDDVQTKARAVIDHYEAKMKPKAITAANAPKVKGLQDVCSLAYVLHQLGYLHDDAIRESQVEGDGSKVPAMLANALKVLADVFLAMTAEETAELLAGHDVEIDDDDDYVASAPTPQTKALRAAFSKAGRVLSEENMAHVKGIMKCFGKMMDCRTKALDSHGTTHDALQAFADHIETGTEHAKALMKAAKPKPEDDDENGDGETGEPEGATGAEPDVELAVEAERQKRLREIEIAAMAA
jgi:hypothetical protein